MANAIKDSISIKKGHHHNNVTISEWYGKHTVSQKSEKPPAVKLESVLKTTFTKPVFELMVLGLRFRPDSTVRGVRFEQSSVVHS
jgi:hypothetical protein